MATTRQKRAIINYIETGGKSVSKSMIAGGYTKQSAKNPQKLTRSKTWKEMVAEVLPDGFLLDKVNSLVSAKKRIRQIVKGEVVFEAESMDTFAVSKGLEFAFKIKNSYPKGGEQVADPTESMTDEELDAQIVKLEAIERRYKNSKPRKGAKT